MTETSVFALVLDGDVVEYAMREMIEGFPRHEVEGNGMEWSTRPMVRA
jgi:hypothetical protein